MLEINKYYFVEDNFNSWILKITEISPSERIIGFCKQVGDIPYYKEWSFSGYFADLNNKEIKYTLALAEQIKQWIPEQYEDFLKCNHGEKFYEAY